MALISTVFFQDLPFISCKTPAFLADPSYFFLIDSDTLWIGDFYTPGVKRLALVSRDFFVELRYNTKSHKRMMHISSKPMGSNAHLYNGTSLAGIDGAIAAHEYSQKLG